MKYFHLYRFQIFATQEFLFEKTPSASEMLREMVQSSPERVLKTMKYFIGDYEEISESVVFFRLGRKSTIEVSKFNNGHFHKQWDEATPFTEILLDYETEICAIARNPKVSSGVDGIANQLLSVLLKTDIVSRFSVNIILQPLKDPESFIQKISKDVKIEKFYFTVRRPNVIDYSDFTKPIKNLTKEINGKQTKILIEGTAIDNDGAVALAREAAASGQDAGATYRTAGRKKLNKSSLKKNPVSVEASDEEMEGEKKTLADRIMKRYQAVRNG